MGVEREQAVCRPTRDKRNWSALRGLRSLDRAVAFLSGLHDRLGKDCKLRSLDVDITRMIVLMSEERLSECTETKPPSPGCSLYGFMFDVKGLQQGILVTAVQIFSSASMGAAYDIFAAAGSWRTKDSRHVPGARKKEGSWQHVARRMPASVVTTETLTSYQPVWVNLQIPVYVPPEGLASLYIHSADAWGAVAYRMLDDTGCQAAPGIETHRSGHVSFLTGTFTESSEPFEHVDGFVCAFAGAMEYDVVQQETLAGCARLFTADEEGSGDAGERGNAADDFVA
mmetsp:Transcript_32547/g.66037  ORF Transcript_32547/g.66037 Transcript_32547/m.66037 type:complete len:284 (-) Transcript_32547:50-901(-)